MYRLIAFITFLGLAASQMVELATPMNISTITTSTSVIITFNEVEGATGYSVSIENVTEQIVQQARIEIGGLLPRTTYTAVLQAVEDENTTSAQVDVTFTTLIEAVSNLRFTEATESSITIAFNAVDNATSYNIMAKADSSEGESVSDSTTSTTYTLTGLEPASFYLFYVSAVTAQGTGDSSRLKARTDGTRVNIDGVWRGETAVIGGQINILRSLTIPRGPYGIEVTFPCPLSSFSLWNADEDENLSDRSSGIIVATQTSSWQRSASEIGMNFFTEDENCTFGAEAPAVVFGINLPNPVEQSTANVPIVLNEWLNENEVEVFSAGLVRVNLGEIFSDTNNQEEGSVEVEEKPGIYQFVIALLPGDDCPGGVAIRQTWSMTLKNVDGIAGTFPGVQYFVQEGTDWYSNEAGLIYGYDPSVCSNRQNLAAEVMIGSDLVQAIVDAPDADMTI